MPLTQVIVSALAALVGSAIGALAPVLSNYILQINSARRDLLNRQLSARESLYSDFIAQASRVYADALLHQLESLDNLVSLYTLLSRIRLLASGPVVEAADEFVKRMVRHYGEPDMTVAQMREAVLSEHADSLSGFSSACRAELDAILRTGAVPQEAGRV